MLLKRGWANGLKSLIVNLQYDGLIILELELELEWFIFHRK